MIVDVVGVFNHRSEDAQSWRKITVKGSKNTPLHSMHSFFFDKGCLHVVCPTCVFIFPLNSELIINVS